MHPSYLSGVERGVRNPTFSKLADLDEVLEVSVSTFSRPLTRRAASVALRPAPSRAGASARSCSY